MRVLLVEDEGALREATAQHLRAQGFSVDAVGSCEDAVHYLDAGAYDAMVLDIMLPGTDGLTFLSGLRARGDKTYVLLLTARGSVKDRVAGLDHGADDYLVKPFAFDELCARLRALSRRGAGSAVNELCVGEITLSISARAARVSGREVTLSAREYGILEMLMRNKNAVLTRGQIEDAVWSDNLEIASNIVDVYMRALRKKLGDAGGQIHTVRGAGYVLKERP